MYASRLSRLDCYIYQAYLQLYGCPDDYTNLSPCQSLLMPEVILPSDIRHVGLRSMPAR
jgi:hypothetical protein